MQSPTVNNATPAEHQQIGRGEPHIGNGRQVQIGTPSSIARSEEQSARSFLQTSLGGSGGGLGLPNATVTLLKLELEQKKHELESARRTAARLQDDLSRVAQEHEASRKAEADRREATTRQLLSELERERANGAALRDELERESVRWQDVQRSAAEAETYKLEAARLQTRLKDSDSALAAKSLQLDETLQNKRILESSLREFHQKDQSNVLSGKLLALEQIISGKDSELVSMQKALAAEGARLKALEDESKVMWTLKTQLERDLGAAHIARGETEKQAAKEREQLQRVSEALHEAREERARAEAAAADREMERSNEMEQLRDELRKRQQVIHDLEYQLLDRDNAVAAEQTQTARHEQTIAYQNAEVESLAGRLATIQQEMDRLETKSGEDNVTIFDLRSQLGQKKATLDALSREVQELSLTIRSARDDGEEMKQRLTELQGVEEKNKVLSSLHERSEKELEAALGNCFGLQEKVVALEGDLTKASRLEAALADMERTYKVCREEVEGLQQERRMTEGREMALREELGELRARQRVTEAKLQAEEERRRDVDRKVQLLESLSSSAYGMHGKYMALQQFIHTSTSDVAKAMELNSALLHEIRMLKDKINSQEESLRDMSENRRQMEIRVAEVDVCRRDCAIAMQRAKQLEASNAELQARVFSVDAQYRRIKELEQLLVDAAERGTQFQEELQRASAVKLSLEKLVAERDAKLVTIVAQRDEDVRQARAEAVSANASAVSSETMHEQQQTILKLTAALDQLRLDARRSELMLNEELRYKDSLVDQLQRDLEEAKIPPPPPPKSQNSPQGQQVSFLKFECGRLADELAAADRRFHDQEQRVDAVRAELAIAIRQLKELRGSAPLSVFGSPTRTGPVADDTTHDKDNVVHQHPHQHETSESRVLAASTHQQRVASPGIEASAQRRHSTALSVAQQQHIQRLRGTSPPPAIKSPLRRNHHSHGASTTLLTGNQQGAGEDIPTANMSATKALDLSSPQQQRSALSGGGLLDNDTRQRIAELFRAAQVSADTPPATNKSLGKRTVSGSHVSSPGPSTRKVLSPTRPQPAST